MATPLANSVPTSGNAFVNGLVQGGKWSGNTLTYSFWNNSFGQWSASDKMLMQFALQQWSDVANIHFQEIPAVGTAGNNASDLSFIPTGYVLNVLEHTTGLLAMGFFPDTLVDALSLLSLGITPSQYPTAPGDVLIENYQSTFRTSLPGQYGFTALLHEIGHTLGLKHPHDGGGTGKPAFVQLGIGSLDNQAFTVMSYNPLSTTTTRDMPATPMPLDILAIQAIYGPNMTEGAGNDVYLAHDDHITKTLWDAGGIDTINASAILSSVTIDLTPGNYSMVGSSLRALAFNTIIENVIGSNGNDTISGNAANNNLLGGSGNDNVDGEEGNDTINGNMGSDSVSGGAGNDSVMGGKGPDGWVYGADGNDWLNGNNDDDTVYGGTGSDMLHGGKEHDLLHGNEGNDTVIGDLGNDRLWGDSGADIFVFSTGSGIDTIQDFTVGEDKLQIASPLYTSQAEVILHTTYADSNAVLDLGTGNGTVTLLNVAAGLTAGDILIA